MVGWVDGAVEFVGLMLFSVPFFGVGYGVKLYGVASNGTQPMSSSKYSAQAWALSEVIVVVPLLMSA